MIITHNALLAVFPHARLGYFMAMERNARLLEQHGLTAEPLALCHFLAQGAAETGDFSIVEESGSYSAARLREIFPRYFTPAQAKVYARKPAAILSRAYASRMGNGGEASGEGWKYRGRSFFQTTGKDNYRRMAGRLGVDLVAQPELLATDFDFGLKAALEEWSRLDLGRIARELGPTHAAVLKIARGINVGNINSSAQPNGLAERKAAFDKAWRAFGSKVTVAKLDPTADGILEDGEEGHAVEALQVALAGLGYPVGQADGIFGARTQAAVAAFQMREGLRDTPGKWRIEWNERIATAKAFEDIERQAVTAADLAAKGESPVGLLLWFRKAVAGVAVFLGLDQAADQVGVQLPQTFTALKQAIDPIATNIGWLSGSRWALGLVGCLAAWLLLGWAISRLVDAYRGFRAGTA